MVMYNLAFNLFTIFIMSKSRIDIYIDVMHLIFVMEKLCEVPFSDYDETE